MRPMVCGCRRLSDTFKKHEARLWSTGKQTVPMAQTILALMIVSITSNTFFPPSILCSRRSLEYQTTQHQNFSRSGSQSIPPSLLDRTCRREKMAGNNHSHADKRDSDAGNMDPSLIDPELMRLVDEAVREQTSNSIAGPVAAALDAASAENAVTNEATLAKPTAAEATIADDANTGHVAIAEQPSTAQRSTCQGVVAAAPAVKPAQAASALQPAGPLPPLPIFDDATQAQLNTLVARLPQALLPGAASRRPWLPEEDDLLMFLSDRRVSHRLISAHYLGRLGRTFFACETRASIIRRNRRAAANSSGSAQSDGRPWKCSRRKNGERSGLR
ncbi:hypothetical protein N657DRAFT_671402 [Parathielavia appendiculata]|uniref:Uncharacterized protein n=1 Tax=Parathielavia appendiculata TaxID=2587402 RepID=A0AAN6U1U8_9PEZI|nr:hypothetical protein N657DRAFT_671402 [Parathielavia appendiculata]